MESSYLIAYSSGLLSAVSPCVMFLVPVLLYRFMLVSKKTMEDLPVFHNPEDEVAHKLKPRSIQNRIFNILLFILGFQTTYVIFGYLLSQLLTSAIQYGVKLGFGCIFLVVSGLSIAERIDPLELPIFGNTFLMGSTFALILSINPCTVPFIAIIISLNTADATIAMICFAQGLITPAAIFMFFGPTIMHFIERYTSVGAMERVKKVSSVLLAGSGFYLMTSIDILWFGDYIVAFSLFIFSVLLIVDRANTKSIDHHDHSNKLHGGKNSPKFINRLQRILQVSKRWRIFVIICLCFAIGFLTCSILAPHDEVAHEAFAQAYASGTIPEVNVSDSNENTVLLQEKVNEGDADAEAMLILKKIRMNQGNTGGSTKEKKVVLSNPHAGAPQCIDVANLPKCASCRILIISYTIVSFFLAILIVSAFKMPKKMKIFILNIFQQQKM